MSTVRELLARARAQLDEMTPEPSLDAEVLLAHALGRERSWLYAWPEHRPETGQETEFEDLVRRRAEGHPVAHLTGEREFWSLRLQVTADTLVPRPETELLVETALGLDLPAAADVLDLGTGTGAIALALAHERPGWRLTAVDRSAAAIAVAEQNRRRLGFDELLLLQGDWFSPLTADRRFDLIVSNPPYVAQGDAYLERGDLPFEPLQALVSGDDGLDAIRHIAARAPAYLKPGGWLWLEHGYDQAEAVRALLRHQGFTAVTGHRDLAGHDRVSGGRRPPD